MLVNAISCGTQGFIAIVRAHVCILGEIVDKDRLLKKSEVKFVFFFYRVVEYAHRVFPDCLDNTGSGNDFPEEGFIILFDNSVKFECAKNLRSSWL